MSRRCGPNSTSWQGGPFPTPDPLLDDLPALGEDVELAFPLVRRATWSMAGLSRSAARLRCLWGSVCHHVKREASCFIYLRSGLAGHARRSLRRGAHGPSRGGDRIRAARRPWPPARPMRCGSTRRRAGARAALAAGRAGAPYRAYVRRRLHTRAEALGAGRPLTREDLRRLWQEPARPVTRPRRSVSAKLLQTSERARRWKR
jgi:hypothetical protein